MPGPSDVPLPGPRFPQWGCACGMQNWRSRIQCRRCDKRSPQRIRDQALSAAKRSPNPGSRSRPRPAQAALPPLPAGSAWKDRLAVRPQSQHLQEQLRAERAKNAELRKRLDGAPAPPADAAEECDVDSTEAPATDVDKLARAHSAMAAIFGQAHGDVVKLKEKLDAARAQKRDALPLPVKVRNAQSSIKKSARQREAADGAVKAAEDALQKATKLLEDARNHQREQLEKEATAQTSLETLRRQQIKHEAAAVLQDGGGEKRDAEGVGAHTLEAIEAVKQFFADTPAALAQFEALAEQQRQRAAADAAVPADGPEGKPAKIPKTG